MDAKQFEQNGLPDVHWVDKGRCHGHSIEISDVLIRNVTGKGEKPFQPVNNASLQDLGMLCEKFFDIFYFQYFYDLLSKYDKYFDG